MRVVFGVLLLSAVALAQTPLVADAQLATFIDEALAARPELKKARAEIAAAEERVSQAEAWSEPMLQMSLQNDGFERWQVGTKETSWILFMVSQTLPFPGKSGLRGELSRVAVTQRQLMLERVRLKTIAEVRRAYIGMLLARARLGLLEKQAAILDQALQLTQIRLVAGTAQQADVLRTELERTRLGLNRTWALSDERIQRQALNRLRGKTLDDAVEGPSLTHLSFPLPPDEIEALSLFQQSSPELLSVRAGVRTSEIETSLAHKAYFPDVELGAGVMARGRLEPMWALTVGVPIPVYAAGKQSRALAEAAASHQAASHAVEEVEQLIRLRQAQRVAVWRNLHSMWLLYQQSLVHQAEATEEAVLSQFRVGQTPLLVVLEASSASISLHEGAYQVLADAWRLAIAQAELSLAEPGLDAATMGQVDLGAQRE